MSEAPVVIKRNLDYPTASKYKEALRGAGISCQIERIENADVDVLPPPLTAAGPGSDPTDAIPAGTGVADAAAGTRKRPGRIWYVVATLLIVVPIVFAGIKMPLAFISYFASEIEITAPGATELIIDQPDNYVIWYTTFDGHSLRRDIPQDIKIAVYSHVPQRDLEVTPPSWESKETVFGVERRSLAEVVFDQPGLYTIEVTGDFPETELILRRSLRAGFFKNFVVPILMFLIGCAVGLIMAIVVFVKRSHAKSSILPPQESAQKDARLWAMLCHFGTFAAFLIPFGNIIVPLVIWQLKKGQSSFVVAHGKESLNFQISLMIYYLAATLLILVIIGFILLVALFVFNIVMVIIAGIKANDGEHYQYPMTIRFFK